MNWLNGFSPSTIAQNIMQLKGDYFTDSSPRARDSGFEQAWKKAISYARRCYRVSNTGPYPAHLSLTKLHPDIERRLQWLPRERNPVPPSSAVQLRDAKRLYENFTGHDGEVIATMKLPVFPSALMVIGECDFIAYTTVRDNQTESYKHDFKKSARPLLCSSPDGSTLFLLGGNFDFTERGIVDR